METVESELRTPLARVRGLGSAKDGTGHWWAQRLTAVALIPLASWLVISLAHLSGAEHSVVHAWLAQPVNAVMVLLFLGAAFHHAQLGLQVVIEDYVHRAMLRLAAVIAVKFAAVFLAVASILAVLRITLAN